MLCFVVHIISLMEIFESSCCAEFYMQWKGYMDHHFLFKAPKKRPMSKFSATFFSRGKRRVLDEKMKKKNCLCVYDADQAVIQRLNLLLGSTIEALNKEQISKASHCFSGAATLNLGNYIAT